ncbi:MAG: hypothetical protein ABI140_13300 [Jatrophihabitantaceae bacterium]
MAEPAAPALLGGGEFGHLLGVQFPALGVRGQAGIDQPGNMRTAGTR